MIERGFGDVRDVGCRSGRRVPRRGVSEPRSTGARISERRGGCFGFLFFSRRWGGVGGRTHRDEGPSQGLVGLLLLDRLGGEENFAVERAAAARVLGRAAVVAAAGVRGARAGLHIRPGDRGEVVVAREKGENLGAIALEGVRADGRAVISGCAVSLSHHRGSRRTRRGARGGLTRSHRREVTGKRARVFSHDSCSADHHRNAFFGHGFPVWREEMEKESDAITRKIATDSPVRSGRVFHGRCTFARGGCPAERRTPRLLGSRTNEDGGNLVRAWSAGAEDASRARRHRETHVASIAW